MWLRLASWKNQSQSQCLKALAEVFKERFEEGCMNWMNCSSLHRVFFLSLSYPSLDMTSAVQLLSLFQSLNSLQNWVVVLKERHYLLKEHCRDWRQKLRYPQCFPPALRSSSIRGCHMRGKGRLTCHAAFSAYSSIGADGSFNRVVTDENVSMQQSKACCVHCSQNSVYR